MALGLDGDIGRGMLRDIYRIDDQSPVWPVVLGAADHSADTTLLYFSSRRIGVPFEIRSLVLIPRDGNQQSGFTYNAWFGLRVTASGSNDTAAWDAGMSVLGVFSGTEELTLWDYIAVEGLRVPVWHVPCYLISRWTLPPTSCIVRAVVTIAVPHQFDPLELARVSG